MPCPKSCIQGFAQHHKIDNLRFSKYISTKEIHYCVLAGKGRGVWHAISNKNPQVSHQPEKLVSGQPKIEPKRTLF